jgi:hypothetical protein
LPRCGFHYSDPLVNVHVKDDGTHLNSFQTR